LYLHSFLVDEDQTVERCFVGTANYRLIVVNYMCSVNKSNCDQMQTCADSFLCVCVLFAASCSRFCDGGGCWGPSASDCISCANYWRDGECVGECDIASGFYANATTKHCLPCSEQCVNTCTGPVSCCFCCCHRYLAYKLFRFAASVCALILLM